MTYYDPIHSQDAYSTGYPEMQMQGQMHMTPPFMFAMSGDYGQYRQPQAQLHRAPRTRKCLFCFALQFRNWDTHDTCDCHKPGNLLSRHPLALRIYNSNFEISQLVCATGTATGHTKMRFINKLKAWSLKTYEIDEEGNKGNEVLVRCTGDTFRILDALLEKYGEYPACNNPNCALKDPTMEGKRKALNNALLNYNPQNGSTDCTCKAYSHNRLMLGSTTSIESSAAEQSQMNALYEDSTEMCFDQ